MAPNHFTPMSLFNVTQIPGMGYVQMSRRQAGSLHGEADVAMISGLGDNGEIQQTTSKATLTEQFRGALQNTPWWVLLGVAGAGALAFYLALRMRK